jgi:hypothetical protein
LIKHVSMALILIRFVQLVRVMHIRNAIHLFITNDDGKGAGAKYVLFLFLRIFY